MISKISIVQIVNKYPKLKKSYLSLNFLKAYFKVIKEIRKENEENLNLFKA